jgi:hypothetical protein
MMDQEEGTRTPELDELRSRGDAALLDLRMLIEETQRYATRLHIQRLPRSERIRLFKQDASRL